MGMSQNSLKKNWGFYLGIFERVVIFSVGIWTFFNLQHPCVIEKGLIFRQAIFIIVIFILPYLAWKKKIPFKEFPFKIDAIILSPFFLDVIGNFSSYFILSYERWNFFDKIAHFWGSGVFTFLAFIILISHFYAKNKKIQIFSLFWLCFLIGIALEGIWEAWEYYYDFSHKTILVRGWGDTIGDVIAGFFGSLAVAGLCSFWYIRAKEEIKEKYLLKLSRLFGR